MTMIKSLNESVFESEVLTYADGPVMIDFWATWCGPCKALAPTIDAIAEEVDASVHIYKCDVDENNALASRFYVRGVPTVIFMKNGEEIDRLVGAYDKEKYMEKLAAL